SLHRAATLARFFRVPLDYFSQEGLPVDTMDDLVREALAQPLVREVALRTAKVDVAQRALLLQMLEQAAQVLQEKTLTQPLVREVALRAGKIGVAQRALVLQMLEHADQVLQEITTPPAQAGSAPQEAAPGSQEPRAWPRGGSPGRRPPRGSRRGSPANSRRGGWRHPTVRRKRWPRRWPTSARSRLCSSRTRRRIPASTASSTTRRIMPISISFCSG